MKCGLPQLINFTQDWCKKYNYNAENVKNFKNAMEKRFSIVRRRNPRTVVRRHP